MFNKFSIHKIPTTAKRSRSTSVMSHQPRPSTTPIVAPPFLRLLMFALLIAVSGCQQQPRYDADYAIPESSIDLFSSIDGKLIRETWDVHTIGGSKVGHRRVSCSFTSRW